MRREGAQENTQAHTTIFICRYSFDQGYKSVFICLPCEKFVNKQIDKNTYKYIIKELG